MIGFMVATVGALILGTVAGMLLGATGEAALWRRRAATGQRFISAGRCYRVIEIVRRGEAKQ